MKALLRSRPERSLKPKTAAVQPRRIVLVEDHPVVSSGLSALIDHEQDLRVCGIAQSCASAIDLMEALHPDLIISEISLKGRNGLELLKEIKARCAKQRVLIFSMQEESLYTPRALRAGASGYVMKEEAFETLLTAIRKVLDGDIYLSERMEKEMIRRLSWPRLGAALDPLECLSDRELEVFRMIGQVKSTSQIAAELHLSIKTVSSHRANLRKKLNLKKSRELLEHALSRTAGGMKNNSIALSFGCMRPVCPRPPLQ
jgi:DNA-binding NarL/FixJ family response regulator